MFEGTLVESRGFERTGTERWTALGSMTIQCAVAGLLIALPLLRPEVLRIAPLAPPVAIPFVPRPQVVPMVRNSAPTGGEIRSAPAAAPQAAVGRRLVFPNPNSTGIGDAPPTMPGPWFGMNDPGRATVLVAGSGTGPAISVVRAKEPGPVNISTGVSQGLLLTPIQPVYPQIARAVRVQGMVVIEAVISKIGRLESVSVVSGPPMLRQAALDAVAAARYRPYLLNGEPTEVKTTYRVVFSLGA
jgi:protein TonB